MARSKAIELANGESVTVNALKLREQKHLVSVVSDLVRLVGELTSSPETLAQRVADFVEDKWDAVMALVEKSLPSPDEADKIVGLDDMVEVLLAIYEVNGIPNLLKRLSPTLEGLAQTVTSMVSEVGPEIQEIPTEEETSQDKN